MTTDIPQEILDKFSATVCGLTHAFPRSGSNGQYYTNIREEYLCSDINPTETTRKVKKIRNSIVLNRSKEGGSFVRESGEMMPIPKGGNLSLGGNLVLY